MLVVLPYRIARIQLIETRLDRMLFDAREDVTWTGTVEEWLEREGVEMVFSDYNAARVDEFYEPALHEHTPESVIFKLDNPEMRIEKRWK